MNSGPARYRAFISYSHHDGKLAQRLHRRLETWSIPRALRGEKPDGTRIDARIGAIFRDRDELASAGSLSRSIEQALDDSAALIVICSPAAVASRWVDEEIAYYRRRHPGRPVFAFVVDGDPALDPRKDPVHAAFPANLARADVDDAAGPLGEPIAADARAQGDGFAQAFLKLVAGLLGLRYDQLRQREQRRRQRRWTAVAALASLLAAVFAALALQATSQITVGLGVVASVARHPAVTAMEIATLVRAYPGRFLPGIGHGVPFWTDQMGLTAQTLTSTRSPASAAARMTSSLTSVATPEAFFGQHTQRAPACGIAARSALSRTRSAARVRNSSVTSPVPRTVVLTPAGSGPRIASMSAGAPSIASVLAGLMPSFLVSGVPEYPTSIRCNPR